MRDDSRRELAKRGSSTQRKIRNIRCLERRNFQTIRGDPRGDSNGTRTRTKFAATSGRFRGPRRPCSAKFLSTSMPAIRPQITNCPPRSWNSTTSKICSLMSDAPPWDTVRHARRVRVEIRGKSSARSRGKTRDRLADSTKDQPPKFFERIARQENRLPNLRREISSSDPIAENPRVLTNPRFPLRLVATQHLVVKSVYRT